ncbi:hypothetical protein EV360DRAFT_71523 [Lentinula raphanica]|nr:hypothetical protein EV360DRAFT_71523 [Lentinula raphanica]
MPSWNMAGTIITQDTYPELHLDDSEIAILNNANPLLPRESILEDWKVCHNSTVMFEIQYLTGSKRSKPFLYYFPTEMIPDRLINAPGQRVRVELHYGWITMAWDTIVDYIAKNYPEKLRRSTEEATSPIALIPTSLHFSSELSKICELSTLRIRTGWVKPHRIGPVLAICINDIDSFSRRDQILASDGARKLKDIFKLSDPPKWVVDGGNDSWPRNLEAHSTWINITYPTSLGNGIVVNRHQRKYGNDTAYIGGTNLMRTTLRQFPERPTANLQEAKTTRSSESTYQVPRLSGLG